MRHGSIRSFRSGARLVLGALALAGTSLLAANWLELSPLLANGLALGCLGLVALAPSEGAAPAETPDAAERTPSLARV